MTFELVDSLRGYRKVYFEEYININVEYNYVRRVRKPRYNYEK
jgi:hypothetical protein